MRRAISTAVDQYGHQKFTVVTQESTAPPTAQFKAVGATAAGQPIYAQQNGQARTKETNRS